MRNKRNRLTTNNQDGSVIVSILVITIFLSTFIFALIILANSNLVRARDRVLLLQAQYAAESGVDVAVAAFNDGDELYSGATDTTVLDSPRYRSSFDVSVVDGSNELEKIVTATGKVYMPSDALSPAITRTIEVVVQRTSAESSNSLLSRNILDVHSGVKNIYAKDMYLNGYILLRKNTTNLIAESITVADKQTGAENCSIGGDGNLVKPSSFSDPNQTRTRIITAYNNCIVPPGNMSNSDFDVQANVSTVSKVHSTFIPWSQYMDNTYQNAPGGCNDWTSGSSPRSIPSTGNTKKTHYPNSANNIATSCGTDGNLALGSDTYHIKDHVHIRANLCGASACSPTFYNPDPGQEGIKFIFVEGAINFASLRTASGSGPIVFVTYGPDPSSKTRDCPLGGSLYLGNGGDTIAPAAYLLASNGLCLDKTKFGADPALGGLSGKNVYISSSPGTPFDLNMDVSFPVNDIPVNLAWKAVRYQRL